MNNTFYCIILKDGKINKQEWFKYPSIISNFDDTIKYLDFYLTALQNTLTKQLIEHHLIAAIINNSFYHLLSKKQRILLQLKYEGFKFKEIYFLMNYKEEETTIAYRKIFIQFKSYLNKIKVN